jgi:hypothetical protein
MVHEPYVERAEQAKISPLIEPKKPIERPEVTTPLRRSDPPKESPKDAARFSRKEAASERDQPISSSTPNHASALSCWTALTFALTASFCLFV